MKLTQGKGSLLLVSKLLYYGNVFVVLQNVCAVEFSVLFGAVCTAQIFGCRSFLPQTVPCIHANYVISRRQVYVISLDSLLTLAESF